MRKENRGLQYGLGGEFGEGAIDPFILNFLPLLPGIERFAPLVMVSLESKNLEGVVSSLTINAGGEERKIAVLSNLRSFQEYCQGNKIRGMIFIVPQLNPGNISKNAFDELKDYFENVGKVADSRRYKVWFVERKTAVGISDPLIKEKKRFVGEMGLCGVEYRHPSGQDIGWFEARPHKKRQPPKERDYSRDERIKFLQNWMRMVIEYRGGEVISASELQGKLERSRSYLTATQNIADARGVYSQEACGCLVHTDLKGNLAVVVKCEKEGCFEDGKPRDPKPNFRLGQKYPWIKCGDCGEETTKIAVWADIGSFNPEEGIKVRFKIICSQFEGHCSEGAVFVDPARIQNPEYIFYSLRRRRGGLKKAA